MPLTKRKLKYYGGMIGEKRKSDYQSSSSKRSAIFVYDKSKDPKYNELTELLNSKIDNFIKLLKQDDFYDEIFEKYFKHARDNGEFIKYKEHIELLLLILKALPELNKSHLQKLYIFLMSYLEGDAITGIFIRKSIKDKVHSMYEATFEDRYFEHADFFINYLIKTYKYKKQPLNLDLRSFTNNNNDPAVLASGIDTNKINFISNTSVLEIINTIIKQ